MNQVKRLTPTKETLRELYLKSGNQCAFPKCRATILNNKGLVVGQICHIEAAMPGGERFNPKQSNEERRAFSNLILLCHEHHIETDDVKKYTVQRLKKKKTDHEKKFSGAVEKLFSSISDITLLHEPEYCKSLMKINSIQGWGNSKTELLAVVSRFNMLVEHLKKLSPDTRAIFCIMVDRAEDSEINIDEVSQVTGISASGLVPHVNILEKYNLITEPELNDYRRPVCYFQQYEFWDMWSEIKLYSERSSISLEELINNMRFSLLD